MNAKIFLAVAFAIILSGAFFNSKAAADFVTATYSITASDFEDSNGDPPTSPASTDVLGELTFTFDRTGSQNGILPGSVIGFDITDQNGTLFDYDASNSGIDTQVNQFIDFARITFGGNVNGPGGLGGLTNDFRVIFDINTVSGNVTAIQDEFRYVTTVDPVYTAQTTTVDLVSFSVPEPGSTVIPVLVLISLLLIRRRKQMATLAAGQSIAFTRTKQR